MPSRPQGTTQQAPGLRSLRKLLAACGIGLGLQAPTAAAAPSSWLDEARFGVLAHDVHFADGLEHGADLNAELLFRSPLTLSPDSAVLRWLIRPRPAVGFEANTGHDTSQAYVGAVWTAPLPLIPHFGTGENRPSFFSLGLGGAANNGHRHSLESDRKSLGVQVLYHVSGELGVPISAYEEYLTVL